MEYSESKRKRAEKRVKDLKGYYRHIRVFVIINGLLYLLKTGVLHRFLPEGFPTETYYFDWINANIFIWLVILAVHTLYIFKDRLPFVKKWEERQIQKYLGEDNKDTEKYY